MRNLLFIILILIVSCSTSEKSIQEYDELVFKGMLNYKDQSFERALDQLEQAIQIFPEKDVTTYFYAAAAALHLKQNKARELLISSIENTNTNNNYFNNFEEFDQFRSLDLFQDINDNYSEHTDAFFSNLEHPKIYIELDSLVAADQEVRTNGSSMEEMRKVDSTNVARLIEITEKYGWQDKAWLILWHQRGTYNSENWIWNYFKPVINEEIKKGNVRKSFWAQFEDFQNMIENGNQEYGLYPHNFDDYPLVNPEKVDHKRDSVNLPPLWVMNKIYDWPLPDNYNKNTGF